MPKIFLSESDIERLIKAIEDDKRTSAIVHVFLSSGIRVSDLVRLKLADVCYSNGAIRENIRIRQKKTGNIVETPLSPRAQEALREYLRTRNNQRSIYVFTSQRRRFDDIPLSRHQVHIIVKRALSKIMDLDRLKGNCCHVLRRSVAHILSERSGRIETASRWLGHSNIGTTIHYLDMDKYGREAEKIIRSLPWAK